MFAGSQQETAGTYFFSPKGTPFYPGLHNLGSRNWTSDERDPPPALGETDTKIRPYSKGALPFPAPPALLIGTAACLELGDVLPVVAPGRTLPAGVDSRCWTLSGLPVPVALPSGSILTGLLLDGQSVILAGTLAQVLAGWLLDGAAAFAIGPAPSVLAGLLLDGQGVVTSGPAPSVLAGLLLDGQGVVTSGPAFVSLAGLLLDGSTFGYPPPVPGTQAGLTFGGAAQVM